MNATLIASMLVAVVLPHCLRPRRPLPALGIAVWLGALTLRALATLALATVALLIAASSDYAQDLAHVIWHTELSAAAANAGADGHTIIDVVALLPALAIAAAVGFGIARTLRAARSLRRAVDRTKLQARADGSVLVAERLPFVAAIGLMRARVVISVATLGLLDEEELDAALAHERAHISRGHRFVLFVAGVCLTLARWQPGASHAMRELSHQVERDADRTAIRGRVDRLALASAICKVAVHRQPALSPPGLGLSGYGDDLGAITRVSELSDHSSQASSRSAFAAASLILVTTLAVLIGVLVAFQSVDGLGTVLHYFAHHPAD